MAIKDLNKKILFGIGTVAMVVAPIATVISCGSSSKDHKDTPKDNTPATGTDQKATTPTTAKKAAPTAEETKKSAEETKAFEAKVAAMETNAPKAFEHFALPEDFPEAPLNTHYEFNNNEIYNFSTNAKGEAIDHWTTDISNFVMVPYFDKDETTFKVKLVANKGYSLSKEVQFELKYHTELLSWDDPEVMKSTHIFTDPGDAKLIGKQFSSFTALYNEKYKGQGRDANRAMPSVDKLLTERANNKNKYYNFAECQDMLNQKIDPADTFTVSTKPGASDTDGSFIKMADGNEYAYYDKTVSGEALDKPGLFISAPKTKDEVPFEITKDNFMDIVKFTFIDSDNGRNLYSTSDFHRTDREADAAFDNGLTVNDLLRPIDVTQTLQIDGKTVKAISNWEKTDTPKTAAPDASQAADSIY